MWFPFVRSPYLCNIPMYFVNQKPRTLLLHFSYFLKFCKIKAAVLMCKVEFKWIPTRETTFLQTVGYFWISHISKFMWISIQLLIDLFICSPFQDANVSSFPQGQVQKARLSNLDFVVQETFVSPMMRTQSNLIFLSSLLQKNSAL